MSFPGRLVDSEADPAQEPHAGIRVRRCSGVLSVSQEPIVWSLEKPHWEVGLGCR